MELTKSKFICAFVNFLIVLWWFLLDFRYLCARKAGLLLLSILKETFFPYLQS